MKALRIRKNFLFDRELVEDAQKILTKRHKNLTEAFTLYLKAVVKEPEILEQIEKSAKKRTGGFIGLLDGEIGPDDYKTMRDRAYTQRSEKE